MPHSELLEPEVAQPAYTFLELPTKIKTNIGPANCFGLPFKHSALASDTVLSPNPDCPLPLSLQLTDLITVPVGEAHKEDPGVRSMRWSPTNYREIGDFGSPVALDSKGDGYREVGYVTVKGIGAQRPIAKGKHDATEYHGLVSPKEAWLELVATRHMAAIGGTVGLVLGRVTVGGEAFLKHYQQTSPEYAQALQENGLDATAKIGGEIRFTVPERLDSFFNAELAYWLVKEEIRLNGKEAFISHYDLPAEFVATYLTALFDEQATQQNFGKAFSCLSLFNLVKTYFLAYGLGMAPNFNTNDIGPNGKVHDWPTSWNWIKASLHFHKNAEPTPHGFRGMITTSSRAAKMGVNIADTYLAGVFSLPITQNKKLTAEEIMAIFELASSTAFQVGSLRSKRFERNLALTREQRIRIRTILPIKIQEKATAKSSLFSSATPPPSPGW